MSPASHWLCGCLQELDVKTLVFIPPQQSFSQPLLASGCEAHRGVVVNEICLMRFHRKHWLSSGELKFSTAGEMSGEVLSTDMGILLLVD